MVPRTFVGLFLFEFVMLRLQDLIRYHRNMKNMVAHIRQQTYRSILKYLHFALKMMWPCCPSVWKRSSPLGKKHHPFMVQLIATKKKAFSPVASWTFDHTDLFHRVHGTSNFMEEIEHEESCSKKGTCQFFRLFSSSNWDHSISFLKFFGKLPEDATPPKRRGCCSKPPAGVTSNKF